MEPSETQEAGRTGVAEVDSVLDSLAELDGLPVSDHAALFQAAQERLRSALADPAPSATDRPSASA